MKKSISAVFVTALLAVGALAPSQTLAEDQPGDSSASAYFQGTLNRLYAGMRPGFKNDFQVKLDQVFGASSQDLPTVADYGILGVLLKKTIARYQDRLSFEELRTLSSVQYEFEWTASREHWSYAGTDKLPPGLDETFPSLK